MKRTIKVIKHKREWVQLPGTNKKVLAETQTETEQEIEVFNQYEFREEEGQVILIKSISDYAHHHQTLEKAKEYYTNKCNDWIERLKKDNADLQRKINSNLKRIDDAKKELKDLEKGNYKTIEEDRVPKVRNG